MNHTGNADVHLTRRHNSGLYGIVWEATQSTLNRKVAVKIIKPSMMNAANAVDHARSLARVSHPNVVIVHQVTKVTDPETGLVVDGAVMEWLEGESLGERLSGKRFFVEDVIQISDSILEGLAAIHVQGIVHGDLHPGNVLLTPNGVKIIDIDYAEPCSLARLSASSQGDHVVGDVEYASYLLQRIMLHSEYKTGSLNRVLELVRSAQSLDVLRKALKTFAAEQAQTAPQTVGQTSSWKIPEKLPPLELSGYSLSGEAAQLLLEAAQDRNGHILHLTHLQGQYIQTNGKKFMESGDPRSVALWKQAVESLDRYGLIEMQNMRSGSTVYSVTTPGYELGDRIRAAIEGQ